MADTEETTGADTRHRSHYRIKGEEEVAVYRKSATRKPTVVTVTNAGGVMASVWNDGRRWVAEQIAPSNSDLAQTLAQHRAVLDEMQAEITALKIRAGLPVETDEAFRHFGVDPDDIEPLTEDDIVSSR